MPTFAYEAIAPGGRKVKGEMEAKTRIEAFGRLERERLQPVTLVQRTAASVARGQAKAAASGEPAEVDLSAKFRLSSKQVLFFTEELSELLEAGLQLEQALRIMEGRQEASSLKHVAAALRRHLRDGVPFSAALRRVSGSFSELYANMVAAGEQSGALGRILRRELSYLQLVHELQGRVTSALVYPAFIALAGIGLMFVFITYLVPQLAVLLGKSGEKMPLATRALIGASDFMVSYWWLVLAAGAAVVLGFRATIQTTGGRLWWDKTVMRLPLVGRVLAARFYAQLAQTLATLTSNGIALHNALKLASAATPNSHLRGLLAKVIDHVGEGVPLSRALGRSGQFPDVLIDMIVVGEQTGDLPAALERIGVRYDKELNRAISALTALIQPAIIVVMAFVVGIVAYSMMGGIFQAVSGLRGH